MVSVLLAIGSGHKIEDHFVDVSEMVRIGYDWICFLKTAIIYYRERAKNIGGSGKEGFVIYTAIAYIISTIQAIPRGLK